MVTRFLTMGSLAASGLFVGCTLDCDVPSCDIRDRGCQRSVAELATCVRGGDPADVEVHVIDADDYIDEAAAAASESETFACWAQWYRALALLELASSDLDPPDATAQQLSGVAAFYDSHDKRVTVLDRGTPLAGWRPVLLLTHELMHALQDVDGRLERQDPAATYYDAALAYSALLEGDAELFTHHAAAYGYGFEPDEVQLEAGYAAARAHSIESTVLSSDPFVSLRSNFVYTFGASYVERAWSRDGLAGVEALYDDPPLSSREVMAGALSLGPEDVAFGATLDDEARPDIEDEGLRYVGTAQLGSFALSSLTRRVEADATDWMRFGVSTDEYASAIDPEHLGVEMRLRADAASLLVSADGSEVVLAWRLRFEDEQDADALEHRLADWLQVLSSGDDARRRIWVEGTDAFVVAQTARLYPGDVTWSAVPNHDVEGDFACGAERNADLPPPP